MVESDISRFISIGAVAIAAHLAAILIRVATRRLILNRARSQTKLLTVTGFVSSVVVFAIYFAAVGFLLSELGISLTTYLASASVIGLAVSFGSQGVVQDVITALTLVFLDLVDVGDMVELGGQVGIVESVGMRFTVLVNFAGARVFVPNRSIANVVSYPDGYVRAYVDTRLPADAGLHASAKQRLTDVTRGAHDEYRGILLLQPTVEGPFETRAGYRYLRLKFRIWPGQGAVLENIVKPAVTHALKQLDPQYADWMVSVHYRSEPSREGVARLPRPAALARRERQERARPREGERSERDERQ